MKNLYYKIVMCLPACLRPCLRAGLFLRVPSVFPLATNGARGRTCIYIRSIIVHYFYDLGKGRRAKL